jgi:uncharacterized membrane protein SpoIIM required for sporulation/ABC-type transport system involved in multi-copper enzyme maturation permease subunit
MVSVVNTLQNTWWNLSRALIVTKREVRDIFRDWRIIAPIVILTCIFPSIANWAAGRMVAWMAEYGAEIISDRLIPFLLMVVGFFPISFSLIIALESFVGEKERHSLEPLLATPLTDLQLYIGKMLSSTLPPLVGSCLGISVYLIGLYFNVGWIPSPELLILILVLTVMHGLVMVSGAVVVSSQATSVRAANLLASFIILPFAFLVQGEALIMFWANYDALWWIVLGLVVLGAVLVRMGTQIFNREDMLGEEIDELNLKGALRDWWKTLLHGDYTGPRRSIWQWYLHEVLGTIWHMRGAVLITVGALAVGWLIGMRYAQIYQLPPGITHSEEWLDQLETVLRELGLSGARGVMSILQHNLRVLALASILATVTFGVVGPIILMAPMGILGYLGASVGVIGIDPPIFWASILPHSIVELPAAVFACAAALRLGVSILSPPPGKPVSVAWIRALADATRLWLVLILPMLMLAAMIEILITPQIVLAIVR